MPTGKWHTTRQHEQKSQIQVETLDLDWSAQLLCISLHVIQGPNVTRDARGKIERLSMMFTADCKRQRLPLIFYSFLVILKQITQK